MKYLKKVAKIWLVVDYLEILEIEWSMRDLGH